MKLEIEAAPGWNFTSLYWYAELLATFGPNSILSHLTLMLRTMFRKIIFLLSLSLIRFCPLCIPILWKLSFSNFQGPTYVIIYKFETENYNFDTKKYQNYLAKLHILTKRDCTAIYSKMYRFCNTIFMTTKCNQKYIASHKMFYIISYNIKVLTDIDVYKNEPWFDDEHVRIVKNMEQINNDDLKWCCEKPKTPYKNIECFKTLEIIGQILKDANSKFDK